MAKKIVNDQSWPWMKANFLPLVLTFNAVILFNVVSAAVYLCCIFGVIGNYIQTASALHKRGHSQFTFKWDSENISLYNFRPSQNLIEDKVLRISLLKQLGLWFWIRCKLLWRIEVFSPRIKDPSGTNLLGKTFCLLYAKSNTKLKIL